MLKPYQPLFTYREATPDTPSSFINLQQFKKHLRMLGLVLLIILAGFGIGLTGGLPVPKLNRRDDKIELSDESPDKETGTTLCMEKE